MGISSLLKTLLPKKPADISHVGFADGVSFAVELTLVGADYLSGMVLGSNEAKKGFSRGNGSFHGTSTSKNPYRGKLTVLKRGGMGSLGALKEAIFALILRGGSGSQVPYLRGNVGKFAVFRGKTAVFQGLIFRPFHGPSWAFGRPQPHRLSLRVLWAQSCHFPHTTFPRPSQPPEGQ